jgi:hypothetical protein
MAFNLQAFGAGFAKKVTEDLDDKRDRINKLADDEAMVATRQRLTKVAEREAEQEVADKLVESLSLYFTPEQIEDIVPRGKIAVAHAVSKGKFYDEKGMSASSMYTMPNNDIANIDTANTTSIGDVSKTADVPEGMGSVPFASSFKTTPPTKEYKTIAAFQVSLLQERIDAGTDPEKIAEVDAKEEQFFEQASKLENAKRKPEDTNTKEVYTNSERSNLITKAQKLHRNALDLSIGLQGQLIGEYQGSNKLGLAELNAASYLHTQNTNVLQEETLFKEIVGMADNAKVMLNNFAIKSYNKINKDSTFESTEALKKAVDNGKIKVGQNYIVKAPYPRAGEEPEMRYSVGTYVGSSYKNIGVGWTIKNGEQMYTPFLSASLLSRNFVPKQ